MSRKAVKWAKTLELRGSTRAVLNLLASFHSDKSDCYLRHARMAAEIGCSVDTIQRALKRLYEMGLVTRHYQYGTSGRRTSNRYVVHVGTKPQIAGKTRPQNAATTKPHFAGEGQRSLSRKLPPTKPQIAGEHYVDLDSESKKVVRNPELPSSQITERARVASETHAKEDSGSGYTGTVVTLTPDELAALPGMFSNLIFPADLIAADAFLAMKPDFKNALIPVTPAAAKAALYPYLARRNRQTIAEAASSAPKKPSRYGAIDGGAGRLISRF